MDYVDQTLYIHDLATAEGVNHVIEDARFRQCVIKGPAVITLERTQGDGGGVTVPSGVVDTVVISAEEGRKVIPVGVVIVRRSQFIDCLFESVSFFAQPEEAEALRTTFMADVPTA